MSVSVMERKVDEKRRVTLPQTMEVEAGAQVIMIASRKAAVVASDRETAEKLGAAIRQAELGAKFKVIDEWTRLVEQAGLLGLKAKDIDRLVGEGVHDEVFGHGREKGRR